MVLCKRRGCGQEFELESPQGPCRYHPGGPVFHEGLKFWSCCKDTNKPCVEFDDFVKLPGCTTQEAHTNEKQAPPPTQQVGGRVVDADEAAAAAAAAQHKPVPTGPAPAQPVAAPVTPAAPAAPAPEPRDADSVVSISRGTACKRPGCGYVADADIAQRDRRAEQCKYHKGSAIFHEGSKGWSCCKRRVLDFDDFLEIAPCTAAEHGHLFTEAKTDNERVQCRIDHYETPNDVHVTVYAKGVEPEHSQIELRDNEVVLALQLAPTATITHTRRFERTLLPFAPIDAAASSYTLGKMKVDLVLVKKQGGESWPTLERGEPVYGYGLTFGRNRA